jgi:hypothetical protein
MVGACLLPFAIALSSGAVPQEQVTLEIRVFAGAQEVTGETRISLHRAGERTAPLSQRTPETGRLTIDVAPGIYDVQAIREHDGRVIGIRWAERLVVMAYPDEGGHHLEVVNLENGFGALQVRARESATVPDVALYAAGQRTKEIAARMTGDGYALFVVPAGSYDVQVHEGDRVAWHAGIDVPLDRTRLWIVPERVRLAGRRATATR